MTIAIYRQETGDFEILAPIDDGGQERVLYEARGYSGKGRYKNDPSAEHRRGNGPIPRGIWDVGRPRHHPRLGPLAFPLSPYDDIHGRSDFWIHGDSRSSPGNASSGCIVLDRPAREAIWRYGVDRLQVVRGLTPTDAVECGEAAD